MTLRIELFVDDLPTSIDFYTRVLGFEKDEQNSAGYTPMTRGSGRIALNLRSVLPTGHPVQIVGAERPGRGVELVLEVNDIEATYVQIRSKGWPLSSDLVQRSWGLTDFRVVDPDGYYWRVTSRR